MPHFPVRLRLTSPTEFLRRYSLSTNHTPGSATGIQVVDELLDGVLSLGAITEIVGPNALGELLGRAPFWPK